MYTIYILECADGSFYTGITNDFPHRFLLHQKGRASKYTRSHPVKKVVYRQQVRTKSVALKREIQIKRLTHQKKLELILA